MEGEALHVGGTRTRFVSLTPVAQLGLRGRSFSDRDRRVQRNWWNSVSNKNPLYGMLHNSGVMPNLVI